MKLDSAALAELKLEKLLLFSIVPNFSGKIFAVDKLQKIKVELRKLPFLEFVVALSCDYPSRHSPILCIKDGFYAQFKNKILESMISLWSEGMPCLYNIVIYIQDSMIEELLSDFPTKFPQDGEGNITIEFPNAKEF